MRNPDRINIDARGIKEEIQQLAESEERSLSGMARILIMEALTARRARRVGQSPLTTTAIPKTQVSNIAELVQRNFFALKEASLPNINEIAAGAKPTKPDLCRIASVLYPECESEGFNELMALTLQSFPNNSIKDKDPNGTT